MFVEDERVYYYITVMNENYVHPPIADGAQEGILKGMHCVARFGDQRETVKRVRLLGSGAILNEVLKGAQRLHDEYDVASDVWSVTSFSELARQGADTQRWNLLHPTDEQRRAYVAECLDGDAPVVAATDYIKMHAESIRGLFRAPYRVLGTDGFGRSDTRTRLRSFFEVDERFVTLAALKELAEAQIISDADVATAIGTLDIDVDKPNPRLS